MCNVALKYARSFLKRDVCCSPTPSLMEAFELSIGSKPEVPLLFSVEDAASMISKKNFTILIEDGRMGWWTMLKHRPRLFLLNLL